MKLFSDLRQEVVKTDLQRGSRYCESGEAEVFQEIVGLYWSLEALA